MSDTEIEISLDKKEEQDEQRECQITRLSPSVNFSEHLMLIVLGYYVILSDNRQSFSENEKRNLLVIIRYMADYELFDLALNEFESCKDKDDSQELSDLSEEERGLTLQDFINVIGYQLLDSERHDALGRSYFRNFDPDIKSLCFPLPYFPRLLADPQNVGRTKHKEAYFSASDSLAIYELIKAYQEELEITNSKVQLKASSEASVLDTNFSRVVDGFCLNESLFSLYHQENLDDLQKCTLDGYIEFLQNIEDSRLYGYLGEESKKAIQDNKSLLINNCYMVKFRSSNLERLLSLDLRQNEISAITTSFFQALPAAIRSSFSAGVVQDHQSQAQIKEDEALACDYKNIYSQEEDIDQVNEFRGFEKSDSYYRGLYQEQRGFVGADNPLKLPRRQRSDSPVSVQIKHDEVAQVSRPSRRSSIATVRDQDRAINILKEEKTLNSLSGQITCPSQSTSAKSHSAAQNAHVLCLGRSTDAIKGSAIFLLDKRRQSVSISK